MTNTKPYIFSPPNNPFANLKSGDIIILNGQKYIVNKSETSKPGDPNNITTKIHL